ILQALLFPPLEDLGDRQRDADELGDDEAPPPRGRRILPLPARARGVTGLLAFGGHQDAAHLLLEAAAAICGACAALGVIYTLAAVALVGRFFSRPKPQPASFPPVTVIKPLRGSELALLGNLSSFCRQDYPGEVQYLFGVNDAGDPALEA